MKNETIMRDKTKSYFLLEATDAKGNVTKDYSNDEVTVVWQSARCMHSGNCFRNLSKVFQPKERPWIKMFNATSAEIIAAVSKCPSGALSMKTTEKTEME